MAHFRAKRTDIHLGNKKDHIHAYGKNFPFKVGSEKDRKRAVEEATDYAAQLWTTSRRKKAHTLATRRADGGTHAPPAAPTGPRSLKPPPQDGPVNEFSSVVQGLESQMPRTAVERGQHQRRLALFRQKEAERNAEILAEAAAAAHATSEDVVGLRQTLDSLLAEAEHDGQSTPARIAELKRLKQMADAPGVEPYSVWNRRARWGLSSPLAQALPHPWVSATMLPALRSRRLRQEHDRPGR